MGDGISPIFCTLAFLLLVVTLLSGPVNAAEANVNADLMPQLRKTGTVTQLYVQGKPFLALGGELGNSTASDITVLTAAFDKLQRMHLNTVMLPVYWDLIEPQEGKYDFSLVQQAILQARAHNLHLVYLWFGAWKNSMSCYAPSWVKRDTARFERARQSSGESMEIISPANQACRKADARAFAALMQWTRQFDADHQTVIMVQVENEIGMIPEARDHSPSAQALYETALPADLLASASKGDLGPDVTAIWTKAGRKTTGNWSDVFGASPEGDEIFSAWQFATYVQTVAATGKQQYRLPMFVNAALIRPGLLPGKYPSAGPLPHLLEIWRLGAPAIDMICPDIYFPNFQEWSGRYVRNGNPLFIPEMAASARAPGNALYAIAHCNAMGCGPFSIENVAEDRERQITQCYDLLTGLSPLVLQCQQQGKILGLSPQIEFDWKIQDQPQQGQLGGIIFDAQFDHAATGDAATTVLPTLGAGRWEAPVGTPLGSAMILQIAPEEFIVMGMGVIIKFSPADGKGHIGIDQVQEGRFDNDGAWVGGRWLNGDETHQGRHIHLYDGNWTIQRVKLYRYD
jgi:beta-galactosidase GanA